MRNMHKRNKVPSFFDGRHYYSLCLLPDILRCGMNNLGVEG